MNRIIQRILFVLAVVGIVGPAQAYGGSHWSGWARRPWSPRDLGVTAWYEGPDYNSGTGVWTDRSTNGNNTTSQATKATTGTAINGLPSVHWAGSASSGQVTPSVTVGPFTVIVVGKVTTAAGYICVQKDDGGADGAYMYGTTGDSIDVHRASSTSSKNRASNWFANNTSQAVAWRFNGTQATLLLDIGGSSQSLTNVSNHDIGTATVSGSWYIGASDTGTAPITGDISMWMLVPRSIDATELGRIFFYTLGKWGI